MGHAALQRVLVRMLYDDAFVREVHEDAEGALAGEGLSDDERAWLAAADPRAFRADPLRRQRTLRILNDEFKASTTLALAETRSLSFALGFFSSTEFHEAVRARRVIVTAYGEYLLAATRDGRLRTPQLPEVIRLEAKMAGCRRDARAARTKEASSVGGAPQMRLAPGVGIGAFGAHVLDTVHRVEQYLFEVGLMPAVALCDDAPRIVDLPPVSEERVFLLFTTDGANVAMTYAEPPVFALLESASHAATRASLESVLGGFGMSAAAARAAVDGFLAEGLLAEI
jgi:hypothetical protein